MFFSPKIGLESWFQIWLLHIFFGNELVQPTTLSPRIMAGRKSWFSRIKTCFPGRKLTLHIRILWNLATVIHSLKNWQISHPGCFFPWQMGQCMECFGFWKDSVVYVSVWDSQSRPWQNVSDVILRLALRGILRSRGLLEVSLRRNQRLGVIVGISQVYDLGMVDSNSRQILANTWWLEKHNVVVFGYNPSM